MSTPTVVLVHGFWGGAAHWANVILELSRRGHTNIRAVEIPLMSLADDALRTREMVQQADGPVVLVGHSYGGAVISEAGNLPNVTGLVYVAAFAPDGPAAPRIPGLVRTTLDQAGQRSRRVSRRMFRTTTRSSWP